MLEHFLVSEVFAFFLIFCRIAAGIMTIPGFGESYVSPTIRLSFALILTLVLTPVLGKSLPAMPNSAITLALLVLSEIIIGVFIGSICTILISVTHVAGMIFSFQSGMSSAVIFDATQSSQGSLIGNFMGLLAVVLLFTTDLHYLMLRGITESYSVFVPGQFPPLHLFLETLAHTVSETFAMAVQISAPPIVVGTLLFLSGGILGRLMPTVQVFFIIIPPQLLIGFLVLITSFSAMMLWFMEFYKDKLMSIMGYLH